MQIVIDIPQGLKIDFENENWTALTCAEMKNALMNGTPLPKGHGRLIDADTCLERAWQDFYRQEDEHEKNHKDYDIFRDRLYEQAGFECCQQAIASAPTIIEAESEVEE